MELRKTDSEDLPRANCTGAVHRCIRPQLLFVSPSDHRASPRVLRLHFKVAIRSTPAVRLTGCSSFLRFIRNSRFRRINALPGANTNAILVEIAAFESTFEKG